MGMVATMTGLEYLTMIRDLSRASAMGTPMVLPANVGPPCRDCLKWFPTVQVVDGRFEGVRLCTKRDGEPVPDFSCFEPRSPVELPP